MVDHPSLPRPTTRDDDLSETPDVEPFPRGGSAVRFRMLLAAVVEVEAIDVDPDSHPRECTRRGRRLKRARSQMLPLTYPKPPLRDDIVCLRPWSKTDLACVEAAGSDPYIPETTTVPAEFTEAEGLAWIERQHNRLTNGEGISLAVADARSNDAIGAAVLMLGFRAGTMSIGYWLVPAARGQGLASRVVAMLASWALTRTGAARVEALVEPDNTASVRILETAGFKREGLLRSYLTLADRRADVLVYSLITSDFGADSLETP